MFNKSRFWILMSLVALGLPILAAACGDLEDQECDPAVDGASCVCTDDESGATCDPADDEEGTCTCTLVSDNGSTSTNGGTTSTNGTTVSGWRFVLVEDNTSPVAGEFPGVDADAIEVTDATGNSFFATTVEDFQLGGGSAQDTSQILGAPDSNCQANSGKFVALGGQAAGGYIIVGFSSGAQDVTFGAGSTVTVHELGAAMCGQFDDDPYAISVSVSSDKATFTQIGTATGMTAIPVTSNP